MIEQESLTSAPTTSRTNRWAIAAVALAALTVAGVAVLGHIVTAIFAVGAGHVALRQIAERSERGRALAVVGLVIGYGTGVYVIVESIVFVTRLALQGP